MSSTDNLPTWLFDVDEYDNFEEDVAHNGNSNNQARLNHQQSSLLEELEIDPALIFRNIVWMLIGPCMRLAGRSYKRHQPYLATSNLNRNNIDFWGPFFIISLYCLVLWLGRVRDVPWIFVIWTIAATMNHLVSRVWYHSSSLLVHVALLGYSVAPIIPFALLSLFISPPLWLGSLLQIISILWSSISAINSYTIIIAVPNETRNRVQLLFPVVVLMQWYITSLIPFKKR